ncbi:MAG: T9SS type A sorting domain-containing protein [Saprospiraceae bacterium]|nr:T9SS type A sorting domain-containing protein [Candidatus Brachybacter algidus]MBK8748610.1 T9SS type A sorting domain-containing protein [Candidatus Brachybacter algidus]
MTIPNVTSGMQGVYTVYLTDEYGCEISSSKGVEILQTDDADAGLDQLICTENTYNLSANTPSFGNGMWSVISGTGTFADATDPNTLISDLSAGENKLVWTITSYFTCPSSSDTINLTIGHPAPEITSNAPLCEGSTLILEIVDPSPFTNFNWFDPNNNLVGTTSTLTIPNVTPSMQGVYTVYLTDEYGCEISASKGVEILQTDDADAGTDQLLCTETTYNLSANAPSFGNGMWSVVSGTGAFADETDPLTLVSDLSPGENMLVWTITSYFTCPSSSDTIILTIGHPAPEITSNAPLCEGSTMILEIVDPSPFTSFNWFDPNNNLIGTTSTLTIPNVTPGMQGVYTVYLTDEYGCEISASKGVEILQTDEADAGTDQLFCTETTYNLSANTPNFGTGLWSVISGTATFADPTDPTTLVSDLSPGENMLVWTITSYFTCPSSSDTIILTIGHPAPEITSNAPLCQGLTMILEIGDASPFTTFNWFDPNNNLVGTTSTLTIPNVTPGMQGVYSVYLTDEYGCEISASKGVEILQTDDADAGTDQLLCTETTYNLSANTPNFGTGMWSVLSGTATFADPTDPATLVSDLSPGENKLVWTITSYFTCPASSDTITLTVGHPAPEITSNAPLCVGSTLILETVNPLPYNTFNWFDPSNILVGTTSTLEISNITLAMAGTYTLITTDEFGCEKSSSIEVMIEEADIANAGIDQLLCSENTFTMEGNQPLSGEGLWTILNGNGTIENPTNPTTLVSDLGIGENTFIWTITPINGCAASSDTVIITIGHPVPEITSNAPLCEGSTLILEIVDPSPYTIFNWFDPNNNLVGTTSTLEIPNITFAMAGTYTLITTDEFGCEKSTSIEVMIEEADIANAGNDQLLCSENTFTMEGNQPLSGEGLWTILSGSGTIENPANPTTLVTDLGIGENTFVWTITPINGCSESSDSVIITIGLPAPEINSNSPLCEGSTLILQTVNPSPYTIFNWFDPNNNLVGTTSTLEISNVTSSMSGLYTLASIDIYGCEKSTSIDIEIQVAYFANAGDDQLVCNTTTIVLSAEIPPNGVGTWTLTQGTGTIIDVNDANSVVTGLSPGQNSFLWTIDPENTCTSSSDEVIITVGLPNISIASNAPICQGNELVLTGQGNNFLSYIWSGPSGFIGAGQQITITQTLPEISGTYQLTATDIYGCSAVTTIEVIIEPNPIANAGTDQFACSSTDITLNANLPSGTTGQWNIIQGSGMISDISNPSSLFTNQAPFDNVMLTWTLTSVTGCIGIDTILLNYTEQSPPAFAGDDFTACQSETLLSLNASTPGNGQGTWSILDGSADFSDVNDPNTTITNFSPGIFGTLVLKWQISDQCHSGLPTAEDILTININQTSGPAIILTEDVNLCQNTELAVAADNNYIGQGMWSIVNGSGTIINPQSPATMITDLGVGATTIVQWTVTNGVCPVVSSVIEINVDPMPDAAIAGPDQQFCNETSFVLNASPVINGQGSWNIINGSGNIQNSNDPASLINGLVPGSDVDLIWKVTSGVCPERVDTLKIINDALPSVSIAGEDHLLCNADVINISANEAITGIGMWNIIEGTASINSPNETNTLLQLGTQDSLTKVAWTISNGVCPASSDTLQIINYQLPDEAIAGDDIMACLDSLELFAQPITIGSGIWQIEQGSGQIADVNASQTTISGLPNNESVILTWTVSNGVCPENRDTLIITTAQNFLVANAGVDLSPCSAESILLNAEAAPGDAFGFWTIISGPGVLRDAEIASSWIDDLISGQQTTVVWTLSEGTCPELVDTMHINNLNGADISANFLINKSACLGESLAIIDVSNLPETTDIIYNWTSNGAIVSHDRDPILSFDESGFKDIQLEIRLGDCTSISPIKEVYIFDCLSGAQDSTVIFNNVSAFPNPTTGKVRIEIEQTDQQSLLLLYNASGKLIFEEKVVGNRISKDLYLNEPGLYFIKIINPKFEKNIKILKL